MKKQSLRFRVFGIMSYAREHAISDEEVMRCCKIAAKDYNPKEDRMLYELHVLGCLESLVVKKFGWDYFIADVRKVAESFNQNPR